MLYNKNQKIIICGPCAIESASLCKEVAQELAKIQKKYPELKIIFKSSFDKANRMSGSSKRGVGMDKGLSILQAIKDEFGFPVLTDIHETHQAQAIASVCDVLQIPAFLCRQTDLFLAAAATQKTVNIKKGQFLSPYDMQYLVQKLREANAKEIWQTERGTTFGYNHLVVDMKAFQIMHHNACPVIFDAAHSVHMPGAAKGQSGGEPQFIPDLARAACATGYVDGLFIEAHPTPAQAISDANIQFPLEKLESLIASCVKVWGAVS